MTDPDDHALIAAAWEEYGWSWRGVSDEVGAMIRVAADAMCAPVRAELAKYEGGTWRIEHGHRWAKVRVDWCAAPFHCDMVCDVERDVWTGPERQPADQGERMLPTGSGAEKRGETPEATPSAGDRDHEPEPVMAVQSFDHWLQPTQEQLDDAGTMPQFVADLIAEAKGALDAQS